MLGLNPKELKLFRKLKTPIQIQNFLDSMPMNHEKGGETHRSPRYALKAKKAHCIEGALIAATALWVNGEEPLLLDLVSVEEDDDHVVTLYKRNGHWGAISKTNHPGLQYRDPIYKTIRELAVSYFHEWYFFIDGIKTLRTYSKPLNLKKLGSEWITAEGDLWFIDSWLEKLPHYRLFPKENQKFIRNARWFERQAAKREEWLESDPRT